MGKLRYWIPNAVTAVGIVFAALSIRSSIDGHYRTAAWWALYCLLTDKVDGAIARTLRASTAFGAQLDSFADFISFGVAPATLYYAFYSNTPSAGWGDPLHRLILSLIVLFHLVCVAVRLARFNVTHDVQDTRFFFGWPTTYIGGMLSAMFVLGLKYSDPAWTAGDVSSEQLRLFGALSLQGAMAWLPWIIIPGGITMLSKLRMPKVNRTGVRWIDGLMLAGFISGYGTGLVRRLPEYLVAGGVSYMFIAMRYHFVSDYARRARLPPLFPDEPDEPERHRGAAA